jgi:hypothetical protein
MDKRTLGSSLIVVLLLVIGCGATTRPSPPFAVPETGEPIAQPTEQPTEEPASEPEARVDPTVVAQGFTASVELDSASYAVVIGNPNPTTVPRFVDVSVTFLDAEGTVLTTATQNVNGMLPESETAVAGDASQAGSATEMEVEVSLLNALPGRIRSSLSDTGHYEYVRVETAGADLGGIRTTGAVVSSFESEQINVPIHVVYYDAAGEVVGGASTLVDQLPPGGEVTFEANTSVTVPDIAEARVFGQIGFGA